MMKKKKGIYLYSYFMCVLIAFFSLSAQKPKKDTKNFYPTAKPMVRWWWFATNIKEEDVRHQLLWAKAQNFGGVELCWLYPLYRYQDMYAKSYNRFYPIDTSAQKWLSNDWVNIVTFTKKYADSIGLTCDFTFGSAWVIAGLDIDKKYNTKIYGDSNFIQELNYSWAWPKNMTVIDHLDKKAFEIYSEPIVQAMRDALKVNKRYTSLFVDSWEIKLNGKNKIWTPGFEHSFEKKFGYDLIPFMDAGLDSFADVRYDYMCLMDEYVTKGFYIPFVEKCKSLGVNSRVQCLGSPTDVMSTYALVDIPESEAMLNNPNYSRIVSSAAALANKKLISAESFTCMYGFPATYLRKEQTADLKLIADALFSQGINQLIYHGMPFNPKGSDSIDFFATTYFGPNGNLSNELPQFNAYVEKVSSIMQKGKTFTDIAVYIPYEDGVMQGAYPSEQQRVWVWGEYEMRYLKMPKEVEGYHPLWINRGFLEKASCIKKKLVLGDAIFSALYIDVNFMDYSALKKVLALAQKGLPVVLKRNPSQPGKIKARDYNVILSQLIGLKNVNSDFSTIVKHPPLLSGDSTPAYWCRQESDGTMFLFIAQWGAKNLSYPLYAGQSMMDKLQTNLFSIRINGKLKPLDILFNPYQSVVLKILPNGKIENLEINFIPKTPLVLPKEKQRMNF